MKGQEIACCQIAFDFFLRLWLLLPANSVEGAVVAVSSRRKGVLLGGCWLVALLGLLQYSACCSPSCASDPACAVLYVEVLSLSCR